MDILITRLDAAEARIKELEAQVETLKKYGGCGTQNCRRDKFSVEELDWDAFQNECEKYEGELTSKSEWLYVDMFKHALAILKDNSNG